MNTESKQNSDLATTPPHPRQQTIPLNRRGFLATGVATGIVGSVPYHATAAPVGKAVARGSVFDQTDPGKRGIPDVLVSNGRSVTKTDQHGQWDLPMDDDDDVLFVIKPRDWMLPLNENRLPQYSRLHLPQGSAHLKYGGIAPTGQLLDSVDFGLRRQPESDRFKALFCGDPQPRNLREIDYISKTLVPFLQDTDAAFGISLGDIMFDDLSLYGPLNQAIGLVGVPWFNVLGNHDLDFDSPDNVRAHDTFRQNFGASYYSFNWGPVHFIVLDNVYWYGGDPTDPNQRRGYIGKLGAKQLEFVKNDLEHVAEDQLVVLSMHIPLTGVLPGQTSSPALITEDAAELLRLLAGRPHTISFAAHLHVHAHLFLDAQSGWTGPDKHHHIVTGTLCGSWFRGAPDAKGVPHGTMTDGTPRGFLELEFDGNRLNIDGYRVIGRPAGEQMRIGLPPGGPAVQLRGQPFYVNVFNGSERSTVQYRIVNVDPTWRAMEQAVEPEPHYVALFERDQQLEPPYLAMPKPHVCTHLWKATLPDHLPAGSYLVEVRENDVYGNQHRGAAVLRVS